jgi:hypothetical protein
LGAGAVAVGAGCVAVGAGAVVVAGGGVVVAAVVGGWTEGSDFSPHPVTASAATTTAPTRAGRRRRQPAVRTEITRAP